MRDDIVDKRIVPFLDRVPARASREGDRAFVSLRSEKNGGLPKANVGFRKVAKITHFLAAFSVHPNTVHA
ncbi:MAG TPA: hypothetical protein VN857_08305 [Chthoniobacterales bacterium]|jgi:hypothetical protein|nr:hypothetical protein [Chthoniobacterales bacterium]